ncbi:MAG: M42 family metallopeptidase [Clostridioides sp.]|nr:M42 family metallopeptidase [Clostridioides sp.]
MLVNRDEVLNLAKEILSIDSPSGYHYEVMSRVEEIVKDLGYKFEQIQKGCGVVTVQGKSDEKVLGLAAHVDTLGAMVRSISSDGKLNFTIIGGPVVPTLDAEYCKIMTRDKKIYTGTFLSKSPSAHVYEDSKTRPRNPETMEIRIDEVVKTKEDVEKLGICPGDFVFIDTKTTITESGFLKSRFIDDKASVACLLQLLKILKNEEVVPTYTTKFFISVFEEVGHGASYIPQDITELLAVDMGCIGEDLSCTEYDVSICAKDSKGPYDFEMTTDLVNTAKEIGIKYAVDIYPYYGSDVGAAQAGGNNIKGALVGPGVHASHGMERTHAEALEGTIKLLYAYIMR